MADEVSAANERLWDQLVDDGCGYCVPWLDLDRDQLLAYATASLDPIPERFATLYPPSILKDVSGQPVLCLASGGGQQSAVFGLLDADVTAFDVSTRQLQGDSTAAAHYGYPITTVKGDMRDLSGLCESAFDLVFQANSKAYVPSVREVFSQVYRVLRPGGHYRFVVGQPAVHSVEWRDGAYSITRAYREKTQRRDDGGIEFRHYVEDIFNGLLDAGFTLQRVHERPPRPLSDDLTPGSWTHQERFVAGEFAVIARRRP